MSGEIYTRAAFLGFSNSVDNSHPEDLILWSDDTWCMRDELEQYTWMSDDYLVIPVDSIHYDSIISNM